MARQILSHPKKEKTTFTLSKLLLDTVSIHTRKTNTNLTDFITRALVNQLEKEGNFNIREDLEVENEEN